MISPEELAEICLNDELVKQEDKKALYFKKAFVLVFDGLIIWCGNLNMRAAAPRLKILAKSLGLPVAVIPNEEMGGVKKKRRKPGKFVGPGIWKNGTAWDSNRGLDPSYWTDYAKDCSKVVKEDDDDNWEEDEYDWISQGYGVRNGSHFRDG